MNGSEEEVQTRRERETIIPDKSVEFWTVVKEEEHSHAVMDKIQIYFEFLCYNPENGCFFEQVWSTSRVY